MFGSKDCEPEEKRQCKERKVVVFQEPECIEPLPPNYKEKEFFKVGAKDQLEDERAKCLEDCHVRPILAILQECEKRVTRKLLYTAETCHAETMDLMEALDKCIGHKAFHRLE